MSTAALETVMLDQSLFDELLKSVAAQTRASGAAAGGGGGAVAHADALRRSNAEAARANLAKEAEIEEIRRQIAIVRSTEYEPAKAAFSEKFSRQEAAREQIAPEKLIERLQVAAGDAKQEASVLEQRYKSGELPVERFVEEYGLTMEKFHSRDMKYQAALQTIPTALPPGGRSSSFGRR